MIFFFLSKSFVAENILAFAVGVVFLKLFAHLTIFFFVFRNPFGDLSQSVSSNEHEAAL